MKTLQQQIAELEATTKQKAKDHIREDKTRKAITKS